MFLVDGQNLRSVQECNMVSRKHRSNIFILYAMFKALPIMVMIENLLIVLLLQASTKITAAGIDCK